MFQATARCVLLCGLLCVPVLASNPGDLRIRLGGAEWAGPDRYVVIEKASVSLSVEGNPGDTIAVLATDSSGATVTLFEARPADGRFYEEFRVPAGMGGRSYKIHAVALSVDGALTEGPAILIEVKKAG